MIEDNRFPPTPGIRGVVKRVLRALGIDLGWKCPKCGLDNAHYDLRCDHCGF